MLPPPTQLIYFTIIGNKLPSALSAIMINTLSYNLQCGIVKNQNRLNEYPVKYNRKFVGSKYIP
ncbi:MAG: hypothetical protein CML39_08360 [Rhodobacteraceae bacterium]|nr:MAG: hypothetical protein CML39_08360 [Paracoccaceae bacterium]